jgi:hypothetical protein
LANKAEIAKIKNEAAEIIRVSESSARAAACLQNFIDLVTELEKELHSSSNKSDFSGDVRILKSRLETTKTEVLQQEKFRHNIMMIMTETIRIVGASAGALLQQSEDPAQVKANAQKILVQIKDVVEKLQSFQKTG